MGKCQDCGKPTQEEWHKYCPECFRKQRRTSEPTGKGAKRDVPKVPDDIPSQLDDTYLANGYFDEGGRVRREIFDSWAIWVANALWNDKPRMTSTQLRRFFNQIKATEANLDATSDFEAIKPELWALGPRVAAAVGRDVAPETLKTFIDRNVKWATEKPSAFREGFIPHFESVLAFFIYYFRKLEKKQ